MQLVSKISNLCDPPDQHGRSGAILVPRYVLVHRVVITLSFCLQRPHLL